MAIASALIWSSVSCDMCLFIRLRIDKLEGIAFTGNTTTGLALVYNGLPLKAGQEVLIHSAPQRPTRASWVSPGGYHAFEYQWAIMEVFRFHQRIGRSASRTGSMH